MPRLLLALPFALFLLGPAAADDLKIDNVRASYTPHGPDRADQKNIELVPGEELYFRQRITGVTTDDAGQVDCKLRLRVLQGDKTLLDDSSPVRGVLALGGGTIFGHAHVQLGENVPLGKYTVRLTVTDSATKKEAEFSREITVKKIDGLTLINPRFSYDQLGRILAPTAGVVDQKLFFRIQLVGFDRSTKKVKLRMEM